MMKAEYSVRGIQGIASANTTMEQSSQNVNGTEHGRRGKHRLEGSNNLNGKSVYGGNLNLTEQEIDKKKKQAQQMAVQLWRGVFENDLKMDEEQNARTGESKELKEENMEHRMMLENIQKERDKLEEEGDVTEERMRLLDENQKEYEDKILENRMKIVEDNAIVRGMKIERLKSHDMVDAQKQGEKLIAAAEKEMVGMLLEEAKDNIDDELEEEKQEAMEKKQEREELEERIEEAKAERTKPKEDEHEEMYELDHILQDVKRIQKGEQQQEIKKSLNQIVNEMKLMSEDLKGAVVDTET